MARRNPAEDIEKLFGKYSWWLAEAALSLLKQRKTLSAAIEVYLRAISLENAAYLRNIG